MVLELRVLRTIVTTLQDSILKWLLVSTHRLLAGAPACDGDDAEGLKVRLDANNLSPLLDQREQRAGQ